MSLHINIDGKEIICQDDITILQAARQNNIFIPTLCHDPKVELFGGCGICVVEDCSNTRLLRACSTVCQDKMVIRTNSQRVLNSRKTALELLLSDHIGDCRPPCVLECPAQTDCQGYVRLIAAGEFKEANILIKDKIPLPASIGRVCPHPCENACRRKLVEEPIAIAQLKSFAADYDLFSDNVFIPEIGEPTNKKVAVIGGGPGGLSAAYFLRQFGHSVTIYEAMPEMGGMLRYGIPEYRLPKKILDLEISIVKNMGVEFINNKKIGSDITLEQLKEQFNAIIIAIGAQSSMQLNCPGENLVGVMGGIDFLQKVALKEHLAFEGKKIAVVGGGNTAMDACRSAVRLGALEVYNIYRRTRDEMPAEEIEIKEAEEEGVVFKFLTNPIEIIGDDNKVSSIRLQNMKLAEPDASGRRKPVPISGSEELLNLDFVIIAIGQYTIIDGFEQLCLTKKNTIAVDEQTFSTNINGVFAIGDAVNKGADIAINAIAHAKKCAFVLDNYLNGNNVKYEEPFVVKRHDLTADDFYDYEKITRIKTENILPKIRKNNFEEISSPLSVEQAQKEANRCLRCGCDDYFECKLINYANIYKAQPSLLKGEVHNRAVDSSNPYIEVNINKCILCGLCVRVCDEVMGQTALGFVNRGFDTAIKPVLNRPLSQTDCISCGQCVSLCPTGALIEKDNILLPINENVTNTTCSMCGVGCNVNITSKGHTLIRCLPGNESQILCKKGRFEFNNSNDRIVTPMIRNNDKLEVASFEKTFDYIADKLDYLEKNYGSEAIGVSISDKLTNEEISTIKQFAKQITEKIFSFSRKGKELDTIFGYDGSTTSFEDLENTDVILLIGSDIFNDYTIAAMKIKKAVENGAKLIIVNDIETAMDSLATIKIIGDTTENLKFFMHEINKLEFETNSGYMQINERILLIKKAAGMYYEAENAIVVLGEQDNKIPYFISVIAGLSKHIGKPKNGIIVLKPNCNSQGIADAKVVQYKSEFSDIKGLLVFGEDIRDINTDNIEFLMVMDSKQSAVSQIADCVIPMPAYYEKNGTYTSTDRKIQKVNAVIKTEMEQDTFTVIEALTGRRKSLAKN